MALIVRVDKRNSRRKKWQHFKLRFRIYSLRLSILLNLLTILYFAEESGWLTTNYERLNPILESLINKLPL